MNLPQCPSLQCSLPVDSPKPGRVVRSGFYFRRIDPTPIQRYRCKSCGYRFSTQTQSFTYYQKKPELNSKLYELLCSQVSQRRAARLLRISPRTVVKKFRLLARACSIENEQRSRELREKKVTDSVQFDDLITSIHTKCKPVSVSLAVNAKTREILGFQVSNIPARHPLVEISIHRYGKREDERPQALRRLFQTLSSILSAHTTLSSDCDPMYPEYVRRYLPGIKYERTLSRKARSAGFGELKRIGFDPLFSLNHTCAMLRANLNRLARKTWCTSKTMIGLIFHLELYQSYHNKVLLKLGPI